MLAQSIGPRHGLSVLHDVDGDELVRRAVTLGLASAASWGAGDFCGGLASKRAPVLGVLVVGQAAGVALIGAAALLLGEASPAPAALAFGVAAGALGAVGLAALYRGLAVGRMAVVAPVSAVLSAAVPVAWSALAEGMPPAAKLAGFVLALAGIWLLARAGVPGGGWEGLALALLAGCGFGGFLVLMDHAARGGTFWPLAAARGTAVGLSLAVAIARRRSGARRRDRFTRDDALSFYLTAGMRRILTRAGAPVDVSVLVLAEAGVVDADQRFVYLGSETRQDVTSWLAGAGAGVAVDRELTGGLSLRVASPSSRSPTCGTASRRPGSQAGPGPISPPACSSRPGSSSARVLGARSRPAASGCRASPRPLRTLRRCCSAACAAARRPGAGRSGRGSPMPAPG